MLAFGAVGDAAIVKALASLGLSLMAWSKSWMARSCWPLAR